VFLAFRAFAVVVGAAGRIVQGGERGQEQGAFEFPVARAGEVLAADRGAGAVGDRGDVGVGGQVTGRGEARYVTDLIETEIEARRENRNRDLHTQRDERRWRFERERTHYDPDRALAGLQLIELSSRLQHDQAELAGLRNRTHFPAMPKPGSTDPGSI